MPPEPETLRLFVAIELSEEIHDTLGRLQTALRERGLERLRWVPPENIHLTLKFLGETPPGQTPAIREALGRAVEGVAPFQLVLGSFDTFRGERVPRVVWVGVNNTVGSEEDRSRLEALMELQRRVDTSLAEAGFPPERRGFTGHLTLARVRQGSGAEVTPLIRRAIGEHENWREIIGGVKMEVNEIALMRSILGPGGAVYERLAVIPLRGAG